MFKSLLITIALFFTSLCFVNANSNSAEISSNICSCKWSQVNSKAAIAFFNNGVYRCYYDYASSNPDSVSGKWKIEDKKIILSFPEYIGYDTKEVSYDAELLSVDNSELVIQHMGDRLVYKPVTKKTVEKIKIQELSYNKWISEDQKSGSGFILEFGSDGIYKCYVGGANSKSDTLIANWSIDGDSILLTSLKDDEIKMSPFKIKLVSVNLYTLVIAYDNSNRNFHNSYRSTLLNAPTPYVENTAQKKMLNKDETYPTSKTELYSKFIGTYHLEKTKDVEYDRMTFQFKNEDPKKIECVRTFRIRDPRTGRLSDERTDVYEVVKLNVSKHEITLKSGDKKATYKFVNNECGGYDIIIFDQVLVYSCNKK